LSLFRRRQKGGESGDPASEAGDRVLVVGLGNPGREHERTRHNVGFDVAEELVRRWDLGRPRDKFRAKLYEGRAGPGGPRVAVLLPQTYMNDSGRSAGPARGSLRVPLDRVVAIHDEIDIPFGEVRVREGGGLAGHNGLKSLKSGFGSADFWRVRVGVDRPDSTDPEIVAAYVLGRFREPRPVVEGLVDEAARETERLISRLTEPPGNPTS
jgi:PTH1 family peptidyl-tRNA hydrolase